MCSGDSMNSSAHVWFSHPFLHFKHLTLKNLKMNGKSCGKTLQMFPSLDFHSLLCLGTQIYSHNIHIRQAHHRALPKYSPWCCVRFDTLYHWHSDEFPEEKKIKYHSNLHINTVFDVLFFVQSEIFGRVLNG